MTHSPAFLCHCESLNKCLEVGWLVASEVKLRPEEELMGYNLSNQGISSEWDPSPSYRSRFTIRGVLLDPRCAAGSTDFTSSPK